MVRQVREGRAAQGGQVLKEKGPFRALVSYCGAEGSFGGEASLDALGGGLAAGGLAGGLLAAAVLSTGAMGAIVAGTLIEGWVTFEEAITVSDEVLTVRRAGALGAEAFLGAVVVFTEDSSRD